MCGFVEGECAHCAYASRMVEGGVCVFVVHFTEQCVCVCVFVCVGLAVSVSMWCAVGVC